MAFEDEDYAKNYALVYNISDVLQVYDQRYSAYIPYLQDYHGESKSVSFWLDLKQYKSFSLVFRAPEATHVFINKRLAQEIEKTALLELSIDSLGRIYGYKKLFFTFYNENLSLPPKAIFVGQKQKVSSVNDKTIQDNIRLERTTRELGSTGDFLTVFILILMSLYVFLWNYYNKAFLSFYSLRSSLSSLSRKDQGLVSRSFSTSGVIFLLVHILLLGFFYELLILEQEKSINVWFVRLGMDKSFLSILVDYAFLTIFIFFLFLAKYLLMSAFAFILNLDKVLSIHFFEYLRLSMLFYTFLALLFVIFQVSTTYEVFNIFVFTVPYIILIFHIIQALMIAYYTINLLHNQSLYLFYYLCITELTPLLIGVKILLF